MKLESKISKRFIKIDRGKKFIPYCSYNEGIPIHNYICEDKKCLFYKRIYLPTQFYRRSWEGYN